LLLGRLRSGLQFEASLGREFKRPLSQPIVGTVVHAYHPKLHGRLRLEGLQFQANLGKKFVRPPSQQQKAGCNTVYLSSQGWQEG
jgi:hypothetical protein